MPRLLRALAALIVLVNAPLPHAHAQGGLRMGTSVFTFRSDSPIKLSPGAGLAGGLWFDVPLAGALRLQPELTYITAGARGTARAGDVFVNAANPDQPVKLKFTYTYLQVPLLLAFEPAVASRFSPRVFGGGYVGFNQDAYIRVGPEGGELGASESDQQVQSRDYGLMLGGHVSIEAGGFGRIALGAEGSFGLADVRESTFRTTNLGVMVFIGLVF